MTWKYYVLIMTPVHDVIEIKNQINVTISKLLEIVH